MTKRRKKHSARAFRRQVLIFTGCAVVVALAVVYFSFSKTVITITPRLTPITVKAEMRVLPKDTALTAGDALQLTGVVLSKKISVTETSPVTSQLREEFARAGGTVIVYNKWNRAQPLQAGTRLLSAGNVLFRTTERVDVPAGGQVTTMVLADEPGPAGEVAPGRFEIVALWEGLKQYIYAESNSAFTGGTTSVARLTQEDLDAVKKSANTVLKQKGAADLGAVLAADPSATALQIVGVSTAVTSENFSAGAGDEVTSVTITLAGSVTGVAVDPNTLKKLLTQEAVAAIDSGKSLERLEDATSETSITAADIEKQTATLSVTATAQTTLRQSNALLDRSAITGKDRQTILAHFGQFDDIAKTEVRFSPFWVLRAPALQDHIEIRLHDPVTE